jgi:archaemetzincin
LKVRLVPLGTGIRIEALDSLAASVALHTGLSCHTGTERMDIGFSYSPERGQYYATRILQQLLPGVRDARSERLLGVTDVDLFVPVLSFVFGEAQLSGAVALISAHRLQQEFYGAPANPQLASERLLKEALHELGHTFGLRHCADWNCVMSASHSIERVDVRSAWYCSQCRRLLPFLAREKAHVG